MAMLEPQGCRSIQHCHATAEHCIPPFTISSCGHPCLLARPHFAARKSPAASQRPPCCHPASTQQEGTSGVYRHWPVDAQTYPANLVGCSICCMHARRAMCIGGQVAVPHLQLSCRLCSNGGVGAPLRQHSFHYLNVATLIHQQLFQAPRHEVQHAL